jgi:hypothetical protein
MTMFRQLRQIRPLAGGAGARGADARRAAARRRAVRLLRAALAVSLGVFAALLVACGGSGKGLIPVADAGPLQGDFEAVAQAAENGDGSCTSTESALLKTEQDFAALPPSVDSGLRSTIRQGIENLRTHALALCTQPLPQSTVTTPKTTTDTTPTTTPAETQTTSTETQTPPPSPSGPGGGTPAPGEEGEEEGPGLGKGEGGGKGHKERGAAGGTESDEGLEGAK